MTTSDSSNPTRRWGETSETATWTYLAVVVAGSVGLLGAVLGLNLWAALVADEPWHVGHPVSADRAFEVRDRLLWATTLSWTAVLGVFGVRHTGGGLARPNSVWALCGVAAGGALVASAVWVDPWLVGPPVGPVAAFSLVRAGLKVVLILALVLALLQVLGPPGARVGPWTRRVGLALLLVLYVPAVVQVPRGMYEPWHASRILDEMLAPAAGRLPLSDMAPQYGGVLGLPLYPIRDLVEAHTDSWIVGYMTVLSLATVAVLCVVAARMLPADRGWIAPVVILPALLMDPGVSDNVLPAGVEGFYQLIPIRSLLPACVGLLVLLAVSGSGDRRWAWTGAIAGFAALNNFESGVPTTLAALGVAVVTRAGAPALLRFAAAWIATWVSYVALVVATGGTFHLGYWVAFSRYFANANADMPMPIFGNYFLIFSTLLVATATAFVAVWRRTDGLLPSAAAGLYFGTWGLMCLPYYVARSSTWGQLQFFLIPAAMSAVWLLTLATHLVHERRPALTVRVVPGLVLCFLPAAALISSVVKAPMPQEEWSRLAGDYGQQHWWSSGQIVTDASAAAIRNLASANKQPVALVVRSGNSATIRTHLPNASVFAATEELFVPKFAELQCRAIENGPYNTLIVDAATAQALACNGFTATQGEGGYTILHRSHPKGSGAAD